VSVHIPVAIQPDARLAPLGVTPAGAKRAVAPPPLAPVAAIAPPLATAEPAPPLRLISPGAAQGRPRHVELVVTRFTPGAERHGTCALCWTGPGLMAGSLHQRRATREAEEQRPICSRCLVSLEMLAVQFVSHLQLSIETAT
jgi:hypothetical protein